jgi:hypothetical protein
VKLGTGITHTTMGVLADLELPGLDRAALAVALGPWAPVLKIADACGHRFAIAAGRLGHPGAVQCSAATPQGAESALLIAHERIGAAYHANGGTTPWLLLVEPELERRLRRINATVALH